MIEATRLNGKRVFINSDLIRIIEETPDTVVTLTDGEILVLKTKAEEIIKKIIEFRQQIHMPTVKVTAV